MYAFTWANKQLEKLSETIAPAIDNNLTRFQNACKHQNSYEALSILEGNPSFCAPNNAPPIQASHTLFPHNQYAIHVACAASCLDVVHALIQQYGISAEQFDNEGNTPLHYAASASAGHNHSLALVQSLINDYNVTVTLKNAKGQTAYDVAQQDSIRQYLLPIQLQKETQECLDNGGVGLVPGMDLGGLAVKNVNLAPPPTMPSMGNNGPAAATSAIAGGVGGNVMGGGAYVVPEYASPSPATPQQYNMPYQQPHMNINPYGGGQQYQPAAAAASSTTFSPTPNYGTHSTFVDPTPTAISTTTSTSTTPIVSSSSLPTTTSTETEPSMEQTAVVTHQELPIREESYESNANTVTTVAESIMSNITDITTASTVSSVNSERGAGATVGVGGVVPVVTTMETLATSNGGAMSSTASATTNTITNTTSTPSTTVPTPTITTTTTTSSSSTAITNPPTSTSTTPAAIPKAPTSSSSYASTHARRGHSTAGVLPKNSKYKPDGFHSSSSDASLAQKYGHDTSVGPPSGNLNRHLTGLGPPPTTTGGGGTATAVGGDAVGAAAPVMLNPFAGGNAVQSQYTRYGGGAAVGGRNRYPTYDAVSDSVGSSMGAGAVASGGAYSNPYAAPSIPQYNMFQQPAKAAATPTYSTNSWAHPSPSGGEQHDNVAVGRTYDVSNQQTSMNATTSHQSYNSTTTGTGAYVTPGHSEGNQYPQTQAYPAQEQSQHYNQYSYTGYSPEQQAQYQQYQSNHGAPPSEEYQNWYSYNANGGVDQTNGHQASTLQPALEPTNSNPSVAQPHLMTNFEQEQIPRTALNASMNTQSEGTTQSSSTSTQQLVVEEVATASTSVKDNSTSDVVDLAAQVRNTHITKDEPRAANVDSKTLSQVTPFTEPISASELFGAAATTEVEKEESTDTVNQDLKENTKSTDSLFPPPISTMDDASSAHVTHIEITTKRESDLSSPPIESTPSAGEDTLFSPPPNILGASEEDASLSLQAANMKENILPVDVEDDSFLPPPPIADLADDVAASTTILNWSEDDLPPPPMFDIPLAEDR